MPSGDAGNVPNTAGQRRATLTFPRQRVKSAPYELADRKQTFLSVFHMTTGKRNPLLPRCLASIMLLLVAATGLTAWSLLSPIALAAEPAKRQVVKESPLPEPFTCELKLDRHIESLTLCPLIRRGEWVSYPRRGSSMFVPPGQYWIVGIQLEGGLSCVYSGNSPKITLALGKPNRFDVRTPLTSSVTVKRVGRLLKLDYQLLDADGRKYQRNGRGGSNPAHAPQFAIYQGDRQIGSGNFEYG